MIKYGAMGIAVGILSSVLYKQNDDTTSSQDAISSTQGQYSTITELVRNTPYGHINQNVSENWETIRKWILKGEGPCSKDNRHIMVNLNGEFLTWLDNQGNQYRTIDKINQVRKTLLEQGKSEIVLSENGTKGYPFAYQCELSREPIKKGITSLEQQVWGAYDDIQIPQNNPIPLFESFEHINELKEYSFPDEMISTVLGQYVIESSGRKNAISPDGARGILQLMPSTREDCRIPTHLLDHRFAQIDCAYQQISRARNYLEPKIDSALDNLDEDTKDEVLDKMTIQAYHAGMGNIGDLFDYSQTSGAASRVINENPQKYKNFTGEDIAMFILTHNFGRENIGPYAITYGVDAKIIGDIVSHEYPLSNTYVEQ